MWRLERLYLKNFALIKSGMEKEEIELDLTNDDSIFYLFIGKMGSGKSAILGHIQPFATYGTLDSRNQNSQIIEGENGLKEIVFSHGTDIFEIKHIYTWNKNGKTHSTKSYIKLNGIELNENGNVNSFKDIINIHFGIDQNYLRLLRLGSNVTNLIDLKSTERKNYMSSRLYDTEIYNLIHKKLTEIMRQYNAKVNMLLDKLLKLNSDNIEDMRDEHIQLKTEIDDLNDKIEESSQKIITMTKDIEFLSNGRDYYSLITYIDDIRDNIVSLKEKKKLLEDAIDSVKNIDIDNVNKKTGELLYRKEILNESILNDENNIKDLQNHSSLLKSKLSISDSTDQINELKNKLNSLERSKAVYDKSISDFKIDIGISYNNLINLKEELSQFQYLIEEISQNDRDTIDILYMETNLSKRCSDKLNILRATRVNLLKKMNNLEFSKTYIPMESMFRAPLCPTKSCPYYETHPLNLLDKDDSTKSEIDAIMSKIGLIDRDIEYYSMLPVEYNKMNNIKSIWNRYYQTLLSLNILKSNNLLNIIRDMYLRKGWYDSNKLDKIIESIRMREDYSNLIHNINSIKGDIAELEELSNTNILQDIEENQKEINILLDKLESDNNELVNIKDELIEQENLTKYYINLLDNKTELDNVNITIEDMSKELKIVESNLSKIEVINNDLKSIRIVSDELKTELKSKMNNYMQLSTILNDIEYTKEEYDETKTELSYIVDIVSASSSKDGIPLLFIKLFLQNCKDIVNMLISNVFEDNLEILDFELNETDFKIPYIINGKEIEDIESASQGQKAIIEIALSFALITQLRESNPHNDTYNIMLLDEKDSSLYKKDRDKFVDIIFKQSRVINAQQIFMITHNQNSFDGTSLSVIMTTEEVYDIGANITYRLY